MASENDTATPQSAAPTATAPASPPADGDDASAAPKKRAARKRATKKTAAPQVEHGDGLALGGSDAAGPADAAGAAGAADATEAAAEPAKKTARKSAKKAAKKTSSGRAKKQAPAAGGPADDEAAAAAAGPVDGPAPLAPELDAAPQTPEQAPAAGFGLLFQAPETTVAPRRRRATSPAQAPVEAPPEPPVVLAPPAAVDDEDEGAEDQEATPAADDQEATPAADDRSSDTTAPESDSEGDGGSRRRRRGGRGRRGRSGSGEDGESAESADAPAADAAPDPESETRSGRSRGRRGQSEDRAAADAEGDSDSSSRRRRRRRRGGSGGEGEDPPGTVTRVREPRSERDEPTAVKGSTRLEAKKQRRREGREAGRRRTIITEAEFLARRESVERTMVVRGREGRTQIGVLEDDVLVEHYVSRETTASMAGNVYLGRVQNVLPSMEAAFVDIGKGRNAVLYAGEVNWDAAGLDGGQAKRIENALKSGDTVLVQVTKDPIGHKGARLTSQISLPGRYVVYVPEGSMTGISRKLPDTERARLKAILKEVVPPGAGVIVRTAAEGASEAELTADVERLTKQWERISSKADSARAKKAGSGGGPVLLHGEPDLTIRVIRDVFTEDFASLVVSGDKAWSEVSEYVEDVAPDLAARVTRWTAEDDVFAAHRIDEQIAKAMDRKVWLPSGGSLVIDRTEAMTVVDVNTGKFVGSGGNLEETVTKNNLEAAEEIVRQLRLRDIGGIIVIDFIDMVLESNRDLVVRRLLECLGRDRTKHQVAEVTSLGLVQMTRKRVGSGLIEVFSEQCEHCAGRGIVVQTEPIERSSGGDSGGGSARSGRGRRGTAATPPSGNGRNGSDADEHRPSGPTAAQIAAAAHAAALKHTDHADVAAEVAADVAAELADSQGGRGPAGEPETGTDAEPAAPTEPEPSAEAATDIVAEPTTEPEPEPEPMSVVVPPATVSVAAPVSEPVVRPRRKRGRVVAPAGPPSGAEPVLVPDTGSSETGSAGAEGAAG